MFRNRGGSEMPGPVTTLPAMLIEPLVGCSSPATQRRVVVLPQPEGPSSTTISDAGTVKLTPSMAGRPTANCLRRSLTSSVADTLSRPKARFYCPHYCRYPYVLFHSSTQAAWSFTYSSNFG